MLQPGFQFSRRLLRWYDACKRDLPWRIVPSGADRPDPYHVLVSELMLQQTQVATVIPYFHRFLKRFPKLQDLASADEQEVLRLWQGLGYYSRARNLQAAARAAVAQYGGRLPDDPDALLKLPGVGPYTAGAIASIAFDQRVPIVDGNVQRVLCRLDGVESDPRDRATRALLWRRAGEILPKSRIGDFNSALMELGAIVCAPRYPQCSNCPVRRHCQALSAGLQESIPAPRKGKQTPLVLRRTYCIRHGDCWLIEQRPPSGRWAGMWQFITMPADARQALPLLTTAPIRLGEVKHALTHRRYCFEAFACRAKSVGPLSDLSPRRWTTLAGLNEYPLPKPQLRIAAMLRT